MQFGPRQRLPLDRVWLVSRAGELTSFSFRQLDVPRPDRPERAFALSRDGLSLAIADRGRIFVVSLGSGAVEVLPVPAREAVALRWGGSDQLLFVDRRAGDEGLRLDVATGRLESDPAGLIGSSFWPSRGFAGLRSTPEEETDLVVVAEGVTRRVTTLTARVDDHSVPVCRVACVLVQRLQRRDRVRAVEGFVTFDPESGRFGPALRVSREQLTLASVLGWTRDDVVQLSVSDQVGTYLLDWDVASGGTVAGARIGVAGLAVSAASPRA